MKDHLKAIAVTGLALGGVFGLIGTVVASQSLRAAAWGLDGASLVVATSLLALMFFREGNDCVAAGSALWSAALLLTCIPREFANWTRLAGIIGAVLFAITAARIFWGEQILPTASPLPFFAYPFLVLTFAGWIWTLLKTER